MSFRVQKGTLEIGSSNSEKSNTDDNAFAIWWFIVKIGPKIDCWQAEALCSDRSAKHTEMKEHVECRLLRTKIHSRVNQMKSNQISVHKQLYIDIVKLKLK